MTPSSTASCSVAAAALSSLAARRSPSGTKRQRHAVRIVHAAGERHGAFGQVLRFRSTEREWKAKPGASGTARVRSGAPTRSVRCTAPSSGRLPWPSVALQRQERDVPIRRAAGHAAQSVVAPAALAFDVRAQALPVEPPLSQDVFPARGKRPAWRCPGPACNRNPSFARKPGTRDPRRLWSHPAVAAARPGAIRRNRCTSPAIRRWACA